MHFTSALQITPEFIDNYSFFEEVNYFKRNNWTTGQERIHNLNLGMLTLFHEPSTRTRISFEAAMHRLGGWVVSTPDMNSDSSVSKGESAEDTASVLSGMADVLVVRSRQNYVPQQMAKYCKIPLINGGDGSNEHPTQALVDLYTIWKKFGRIDGLKFSIIGDLALSRTAKSLMLALSNFKNVELSLVAHPRQVPDSAFVAEIQKTVSVKVFPDPISSLYNKPNVVYITRPQRERVMHPFKDAKALVFDQKCLDNLPSDAIILHPGPRTEEMPDYTVKDVRCLMFEQAHNGVPVRMQLLKKILS